MRIWQARYFGPVSGAVILVAAAGFLAVPRGMAQQGGQAGGGAAGGGTTTPTAPPPTTTPTPNPTTTTLPRTTTQPTQPTPEIPRPIWINGRVTMYDGGEPPERVTIERLCASNNVRPEGYTDSKGFFSFNLGQNNAIFADASTNVFNQQGGFSPMSSNTGTGGGFGNSNSETALWNCELRARLPGYRSESISLAGRRSLDNPNVGVIVLYPIAGIQGLTASATVRQAPKEARKAFDKGLDAVKKEKPDQAEQEFRKAVQIYPRHAAAWLELGKVLQRREHYPEAREAYAKALEADPKFVFPYQQLYELAVHEQNWKDVVDKTDQLLHLNPYEFPGAYYYNALGHHQLKEYDAAEKSAHQAVEMDRRQQNPKTHYLLGAILVQKQNWTGAASSFRAYLKAAPNATDKAQVEKVLSQLDQQISRVQPGSQDTPAQH